MQQLSDMMVEESAGIFNIPWNSMGSTTHPYTHTHIQRNSLDGLWHAQDQFAFECTLDIWLYIYI